MFINEDHPTIMQMSEIIKIILILYERNKKVDIE